MIFKKQWDILNVTIIGDAPFSQSQKVIRFVPERQWWSFSWLQHYPSTFKVPACKSPKSLQTQDSLQNLKQDILSKCNWKEFHKIWNPKQIDKQGHCLQVIWVTPDPGKFTKLQRGLTKFNWNEYISKKTGEIRYLWQIHVLGEVLLILLFKSSLV